MNRIISKFLLITVLFCLSLNLSGCAGLKKKFTRKIKERPEIPAYYQVRKYDIKPSFELYEKHYIFWLNWHRELVDELGRNFKSDIRGTQEIVSNLEDMATLLIDEKAAELAPHIDELRGVRVMVEKRNMTKANETRIRRMLEREYRIIKRKFSPTKMAKFIREEYKK